MQERVATIMTTECLCNQAQKLISEQKEGRKKKSLQECSAHAAATWTALPAVVFGIKLKRADSCKNSTALLHLCYIHMLTN